MSGTISPTASSLFRALLPSGIFSAEMSPMAADPAALLPEERASVARAVEKRQREFAAGRLLARALFERMALEHTLPAQILSAQTQHAQIQHAQIQHAQIQHAQIQHAQTMRDYALLNDANRVPVWPEGIVGSITHCPSLCAVAVAPASECGGIGLDVEPAEALKAELMPMILRAADHFALDALPPTSRALGGMLAFTMKEAIYKAVYPTCRRFLEFHDVEIVRLVITDETVADQMLTTDVASGRTSVSDTGADLRGIFELQVLVAEASPFGEARITGRFRIAEGHIAAAVVLPPLSG